MAVVILKSNSNNIMNNFYGGGGGSATIGVGCNSKNGGIQQNQLTRSLERILEDAHLSGELKLSGRKLKDFPKAAGKYNLSDTVIADLSRNRFCELPEDVTTFPFLETLFMYHNTLRSIPETIRGLQSLSYLDLRSNQLSVLPREICFLPLQVLLISNNRLTSLPEELGRMNNLTELDAACNQIAHLPSRMSDLHNLKSLSLRSNQLVYLPKEVTYLQLVSLDISCNRIATLPVELRQMTSLVSLELENNPLNSPPASLCVRGIVHVFKYLDTLALKEEKNRSGGGGGGGTAGFNNNCTSNNSNNDHHATLRRAATPKHTLIDNKVRRQHIDSGYSTSDGFDKRWSQELMPPPPPPQQPLSEVNSSKWSPSPIHARNIGVSTNINNSRILTSPNHTNNYSNNYEAHNLDEELRLAHKFINNDHKKVSFLNNNGIGSGVTDCDGSGVNTPVHSVDGSPDGDYSTPDSQRSDDKGKNLEYVQTYKEYKEALRQQRNQDSSSIYRTRDHNYPQNASDPNPETPSSNLSPSFNKLQIQSATTAPSPPTSTVYNNSNNQNSPHSPNHHHKINGHPSPINTLSNGLTNNTNNNYTDSNIQNGNISESGGGGGGGEIVGKPHIENVVITTKRPVQKVIPSRNVNQQHSPGHKVVNQSQMTLTTISPTITTPAVNGNVHLKTGVEIKTTTTKDYYMKPSSPIKSTGSSLTFNNIPSPPIQSNKSPCNNNNNNNNNNSNKGGPKTNRAVSWNREVSAEKLSFTMRREFDKHKEEVELIEKLRNIIQNRLKMSLPTDIASALTDGVVLCHLANHVRPRSVASIHVPSAAVPKLTMAKCRRNVDNFLDACRKIGVDEKLMCCAADVLEGKAPVQVAITVCELLRFQASSLKSPNRHSTNKFIASQSTSPGSPLLSPPLSPPLPPPPPPLLSQQQQQQQ